MEKQLPTLNLNSGHNRGERERGGEGRRREGGGGQRDTEAHREADTDRVYSAAPTCAR